MGVLTSLDLVNVENRFQQLRASMLVREANFLADFVKIGLRSMDKVDGQTEIYLATDKSKSKLFKLP